MEIMSDEKLKVGAGLLSVANSQLKKGYKQTEVGVVPIEWEVKELREIFDLKNGVNSGKENYGSGIKFINVLEVIQKNSLRYEDIPGFISLPTETIKIYLVKKGDVLFNRTSETQDEIGLAAVYLDDREVVFGGFVIRARPVSKAINCYFSKYVFLSSVIRKEIIKRGQGVIRANIGQADLYKIKIPLPLLSEQNAIAEALSDVDSLISALNALIIKKRNIREGAMQQFLGGKIRLLGLKEEWTNKKLGEVAEIKTGKKNSEDRIENGLYPFFVRSQQVERINTYSYDGEAILVPGEGGIGSIFHYVNGRFDYHQRVYKISNFSNGCCGKYIYYSMLKNFNNHAMRNSVKATVDSLRLPTFQEFEFKFPKLEEQQATAIILSDMDAEIECLEQQRDKTLLIKQGMLQELLTGKTRLI